MALDVNDVISALDSARRSKIKDQAAALIAEEMTLREFRKAPQFTQVSVARQFGISQDGVSRLGQCSDLLRSTLRRTVEAKGENLADRDVSPPADGQGLRHRPARVPRLRSETA